eukprot:UN32655
MFVYYCIYYPSLALMYIGYATWNLGSWVLKFVWEITLLDLLKFLRFVLHVFLLGIDFCTELWCTYITDKIRLEAVVIVFLFIFTMQTMGLIHQMGKSVEAEERETKSVEKNDIINVRRREGLLYTITNESKQDISVL